MMVRLAVGAAAVLVLSVLAATRALAQDSGPKVGDMAPEFALRGSQRGTLLEKPIRLADFRGQTVVIAFFPKSRTKG